MLAFKPTVHLNYEETVLPMKDGLPKLKDFPAAIGGSGETFGGIAVAYFLSPRQNRRVMAT